MNSSALRIGEVALRSGVSLTRCATTKDSALAAALLVLREPQVFIGLFLSGVETATSFLLSNSDFTMKRNFQ